MFPLDGAVEGTKPVDHFFQLGRHAIIVKGRGKYQHIRIQNLFAYDLHIVLLHAGAFIAAVDAADAGMDIRMGYVDHFHGMTRFLCALAEAVCQDVSGAFFIWGFPLKQRSSSQILLTSFPFPSNGSHPAAAAWGYTPRPGRNLPGRDARYHTFRTALPAPAPCRRKR